MTASHTEIVSGKEGVKRNALAIHDIVERLAHGGRMFLAQPLPAPDAWFAFDFQTLQSLNVAVIFPAKALAHGFKAAATKFFGLQAAHVVCRGSFWYPPGN
eukprot:CAMPEP_0172778878 /NCGR_PEP_ID=MMETSP1074-20121228/202136_1 /TAXON_ID=2916 /ORGANISM="Ceratium fusus, Strain PA161109" /LENGTH=100 /DNA_ID=CAMNT_0013615827 /DNA_START=1282 /DNA_END=1584 /DNA_ORIENTATION=-